MFFTFAIGVALTCMVWAAPPYTDQRQDGKLNFQATVDNVLVLVATGAKKSSAHSADLPDFGIFNDISDHLIKSKYSPAIEEINQEFEKRRKSEESTKTHFQQQHQQHQAHQKLDLQHHRQPPAQAFQQELEQQQHHQKLPAQIFQQHLAQQQHHQHHARAEIAENFIPVVIESKVEEVVNEKPQVKNVEILSVEPSAKIPEKINEKSQVKIVETLKDETMTKNVEIPKDEPVTKNTEIVEEGPVVKNVKVPKDEPIVKQVTITDEKSIVKNTETTEEKLVTKDVEIATEKPVTKDEKTVETIAKNAEELDVTEAVTELIREDLKSESIESSPVEEPKNLKLVGDDLEENCGPERERNQKGICQSIEPKLVVEENA